MDTEIQKIIKERVKELPVEMVMAIKSVPWVDKMKFIAKNNNLNEQKEVSFFTETVILVLGIESLTKYPVNLAENVGLDDGLVTKIAKEVDEQILSPIAKIVERNSINTKQNIIKIQSSKDTQILGFNKDRVVEIAQKYSLNQSQTDKLINIIKPVVGQTKKPDTLLETIISNLGISRLLAEQIMEDLEVRVFEYALRTVEKKSEKKPEPAAQVSNVPFDMKPKVPEVKPSNLPMVEVGEVAHDNPTPSSSPRQPLGQMPKVELLKSNSQGSTLEPKPEHSPRGTLGEEVQRPVEVPRFTSVPMSEDEEGTEDSKPNVPIPKVEEVKSTPTLEPVHKYAVDPYREPLE